MEGVSISVLMPAYNAGPYIAEAIDSVLNQTFPNFELVIINDGSTDNTEEVIRSFNDERIILINQKNTGVAEALNTGLKFAKGKYIARFDSDDVCLPQRLEKQLAYLENNPAYVITGSDAIYISEQGDYLCNFSCPEHSDAAIKQKLYSICPFTHSAVMYRKEAVIHCGGYSALAHNMEDYLLWVQLSKLGKFYNYPTPLLKVRFNPASVTIDEKWRGKRFRTLKYQILKKEEITEQEGAELLDIIQKQDTHKIKHGSYYALCGKKFLVNNHQPDKARVYIKKAILLSPLRLDNYALLAVSFLPGSLIRFLHQKMN
ncbi:glycosyltransferase family 2 protein [Chitinophagaceae bacterium LWZ2-11]